MKYRIVNERTGKSIIVSGVTIRSLPAGSSKEKRKAGGGSLEITTDPNQLKVFLDKSKGAIKMNNEIIDQAKQALDMVADLRVGVQMLTNDKRTLIDNDPQEVKKDQIAEIEAEFNGKIEALNTTSGIGRKSSKRPSWKSERP